mgnify:CR=1 FL=1
MNASFFHTKVYVCTRGTLYRHTLAYSTSLHTHVRHPTPAHIILFSLTARRYRLPDCTRPASLVLQHCLLHAHTHRPRTPSAVALGCRSLHGLPRCCPPARGTPTHTRRLVKRELPCAREPPPCRRPSPPAPHSSLALCASEIHMRRICMRLASLGPQWGPSEPSHLRCGRSNILQVGLRIVLL